MPVLVPRPGAQPQSMRAEMSVVVVRIRTDDGVEGIGHTMALNPDLSFFRTLSVAVSEMAAMLEGEDPLQPERLVAKLLSPAFPPQWFGRGGLINHAAAALDIAIWDVVGKVAGLPLWRLLGGSRDRVPVYDSSLLSQDVDELQAAAAASASRGYRAMKMRAGAASMGVEALVHRVRAVRDVIGPDVELMVDVNQRWTPSFAIRMGRELEELDLAWIEDPVPSHDVRGCTQVAAALDVPVCAGEGCYDTPALRRLLEEQAVDILMVDVMRLAGITQARRAFSVAESFGRSVCTHVLPEVDAHLVAASPNGLTVEGVDWTAPLFEGLPELLDGELHLSERPGLGLVLDEDLVRAQGVQ
jgi:L-alanine-DL-glutamate epimerase-like enolase superfamily enzyme